MKRAVALAVLAVISASCKKDFQQPDRPQPSHPEHLTEGFKTDARYVYQLLEAAQRGETVLKTDMTQAVAQAKASARSDADQEALFAVTTMVDSYRQDISDVYDFRLFATCRWEAANRLEIVGGASQSSLQLGDCRRESSVHTQHVLERMAAKAKADEEAARRRTAALKTEREAHIQREKKEREEAERDWELLKARCRRYLDSPSYSIPTDCQATVHVLKDEAKNKSLH